MNLLKRTYLVFILSLLLTTSILVSFSYAGLLDDIVNSVKTQSASRNEMQASEWAKKGDTFLNQKNYKDAVDAYSKAISLNSKDINVYMRRGWANRFLGNYQQAILDCDKVIEMAPNDTKLLEIVYDERGYSNALLGNSEAAIKDYDKVLEFNPKNAGGHYAKACLYSLSKNIAVACSELKSSIELGFDQFDHIKKDTDMDNIRDSACYKEIMSLSELPPFTFMEIGSDDNYDSAVRKLNNKFKVVSSENVGNHPGYIPNVVNKWSNDFQTFEKIKKQYTNTFRGGISSMNDALFALKLSPVDDTMYLRPFNVGNNTYYSTMAFSGLNKKIMRINILFKTAFFEDVMAKLVSKYKKPMKTINRASSTVGYYWESEDNFMIMTKYDDLLYDYQGNYNRAPDHMSQLVIQFGKNISEWSQELVPKLIKIEEEKINRENQMRKKAVSDF